MKIINVTLRVRPNAVQAYKIFVGELVAASRQDTGNLRYDHLQSLTNEYEFMIVEHWADQGAIDLHNETPHFKKFLDEVGAFLTEDPEIIVTLPEAN